MILHVLLAGITAFLAARQTGLNRFACAVTGLAYAFSGWLNTLIVPGHDGKMYVTALFPLVVLFLWRVFNSNRWLNAIWLGITIGLIILTPHIQLAYYTLWFMVFASVYLILRYRRQDGKWRPALYRGGLIPIAVVIGLGLSAIQMWPGYIYTQQDSQRTEYSDNLGYASSWSLHTEELFSLFVPDFCGNDDSIIKTRGYWGRNEFKDNSEYAGIVALMLALAGVILSRRRVRLFWAGVGLFALLFALGKGSPLYLLCYYFVPLIDSTRAPSMMMFIFSFSVSILAGIAVDAVMDEHIEWQGVRRLFFKIVTVYFPSALLLVTIFVSLFPEYSAGLYIRLFYPELASAAGKLSCLAASKSTILFGFWISSLLAVTVGWILNRIRFVKYTAYLFLMIPLLILCDGIRFNNRFVNTINIEMTFGEKPMVRFLNENCGLYRTYGVAMDEICFHIYRSGLSSPIGFHGNHLRQYSEFITHRRGLGRNFMTPRFSDLTSSKYIISPLSHDHVSCGYDPDSIRVVGEFDRHKVIENTRCLPRTFLCGRSLVFDDRMQLLDSIYDSDINFRRIAFLEDSLASPIDSLFCAQDSAAITWYNADSVVIHANCCSPKLLILTDSYYSDWHVLVDGSEYDPIRVYGIFRGVCLDRGEHVVKWVYIPKNYFTGRKITLYTSVLILGLLAGFGLKGTAPYYKRKHDKIIKKARMKNHTG